MSVPAYILWERWRTCLWPSADARVIEVDPDSLLEREGTTYYLNLDSDYAIEYEVQGHKYLHRADIENNVRIAGVKIYRSPGIPREFKIRYDPRDPSKYTLVHVYSGPLPWLVSIACAVAGLAVLLWET